MKLSSSLGTPTDRFDLVLLGKQFKLFLRSFKIYFALSAGCHFEWAKMRACHRAYQLIGYVTSYQNTAEWGHLDPRFLFNCFRLGFVSFTLCLRFRWRINYPSRA